jgi:nitroreductase
MHEKSDPPAAVAAVDEAIRTRKSVRSFLPTPVDRATVEELLALASRSPSGSNIQPWRVRVISGDAKDRLTKTILDAVARDGFEPYQREWNYYPVNWREPFLSRRRKIAGTCIACSASARATSRAPSAHGCAITNSSALRSE